jgi:alpha-glucosidase
MQGDKPDERLRTPMQWTAGANGFTRGKAWESAQPDSASVNVAAQDSDTSSLLSWYRTLTRLRARHEALRRGALLPYVSDDPRVAAFERRSANERLLVRINFSADVIPAQGAARRLEPYSCRVENR